MEDDNDYIVVKKFHFLMIWSLFNVLPAITSEHKIPSDSFVRVTSVGEFPKR